MDVLEQKARLHVPCLYDCPITIGQRLILAHLDYQSKYNLVPDDAQTHRATGLCREKVRAVKTDLLNGGWWDGARVTTKFRQFSRKANNKYGYQFFKCYVHQPGQPLSVASVAVWSLIYTLCANPKKPSLTYRYFSSALGLGNGTAQNCVSALAEAGWLAVTPSNGVLSFRLYRLGSIQLDSLRDKGEFRTENASDITLEDAPAPCVGISENVKMCDPFFEANQDAILKAIDRLYRHPNTPEVMRSNLDDFRPWASDVLKRAGCPGDGWEARLDILLAGNVCRSGSEEMDVPLAP